MLLTSHRQHWLAESYTRAAGSGDIELLRLLANKFPISTRWGIDGVGMPEHPLDPAMYAAVRAGDNDLLAWLIRKFPDAGGYLDLPENGGWDDGNIKMHFFEEITTLLAEDRDWTQAFLCSVIDSGAGAVLKFGPHSMPSVDGGVPAFLDLGTLGLPSLDLEQMSTSHFAHHETLLALVNKPLPASRKAMANRLTFLASSVGLQDPEGNDHWFELVDGLSGSLHVLYHLEERARSMGFFEVAAAAATTLEEALRASLDQGDELERWWKDELVNQVSLVEGRLRRWAPLRFLPKLLSMARRAQLRLDAPGQANHQRYCAEFSAMAMAVDE